jgi:hypothetical protein
VSDVTLTSYTWITWREPFGRLRGRLCWEFLAYRAEQEGRRHRLRLKRATQPKKTLIRRFFLRQMVFARLVTEQYPETQLANELREWLKKIDGQATNDELVMMDRFLSDAGGTGSNRLVVS